MTANKINLHMNDDNNISLGKRHEYSKEDTPCIKAGAVRIGFSKEEIKELTRIYNVALEPKK